MADSAPLCPVGCEPGGGILASCERCARPCRVYMHVLLCPETPIVVCRACSLELQRAPTYTQGELEDLINCTAAWLRPDAVLHNRRIHTTPESFMRPDLSYWFYRPAPRALWAPGAEYGPADGPGRQFLEVAHFEVDPNSHSGRKGEEARIIAFNAHIREWARETGHAGVRYTLVRVDPGLVPGGPRVMIFYKAIELFRDVFDTAPVALNTAHAGYVNYNPASPHIMRNAIFTVTVHPR